MRILTFLLFGSFFSLPLLGCGSSSSLKPLDMGGPDGDQVSSLIEEINEALGNPKKFDPLFASGAKPSDGKAYLKRSYSIVGKPSVSGTNATAKVRVDGANGEKIGEVEWSFAKEGDKWKIKSAPLP